MLNNVLLKTLRDKRRTFFWWAVGVALLIIFYDVMWLSVEGMDLSGMNQMMESKFMEGLMGVTPDLSTPVGWLGVEQLPLWGPLIFIAFAVSFTNSTLTGQEEKGTLDLLLSNPISRTTVFAQKFTALVFGMVSLGAVFWLANVIGVKVGDLGISALSLAQVSFVLVLLGLVFGAFALALGSLTGNTGLSAGLAGAIGVVSYFLNTLAGIVKGLEPFRPVSVLYYYNGGDVLRNGIDPGDVGVLIGAIVVLFAIGLYAFERKDIAT